MASRHGRCRRSAPDGDRARIHHRERGARPGVEQQEHSLDGGKLVPVRVAWKVRVHLDSDVSARTSRLTRHEGGLHVEASLVGAQPEHGRRNRPVRRDVTERALDRRQARHHVEQPPHLASRQEERGWQEGKLDHAGGCGHSA